MLWNLRWRSPKRGRTMSITSELEASLTFLNLLNRFERQLSEAKRLTQSWWFVPVNTQRKSVIIIILNSGAFLWLRQFSFEQCLTYCHEIFLLKNFQDRFNEYKNVIEHIVTPMRRNQWTLPKSAFKGNSAIY